MPEIQCQVNLSLTAVKSGLKAMNDTRNKELKVVIDQLSRLEEKMENVEKKLMMRYDR